MKVDGATKHWTAELRMPVSALDAELKPGARLRLNLFRSDRAGHAFLAWNPSLRSKTHAPERFGVLELE